MDPAERGCRLRPCGRTVVMRKELPKELTKPKIHMVPSILKKKTYLCNSLLDFTPKIVSFGPIHHHNCSIEAEAFKQRWAEEFIKERRQDGERIKENIAQLKGYFPDEVVRRYKDEELAEMLRVDGCALLYYIDCAVRNGYTNLEIGHHQVAFVEHDMFLLENQLPFAVLDYLVASNSWGDWMEKIKNFFGLVISLFGTRQDIVVGEFLAKDKMPAHLLDFLRVCLLWDRRRGQQSSSDDKEKARRNTDDLESNQKKQEEMQVKSDGNRHSKHGDEFWQSFRSIVELKASGIKFEENRTRQGFDDIIFTKNCCSLTLKIPRIIIDDSSGPLLKNLVAYEMCLGYNCDMEITSYICFLDTFIDHPEDVKELRKANILRNLLGSDQEVSQLFNEIGRVLVANDLLHNGVRKAIQEHYKSRWKTKWAEFRHTYFSSPWSFITFIAALIIFLLANVQTYFTIWPRK